MLDVTNNSFGSIDVPLEEVIFSRCKDLGIKLNEFTIKDFSELDSILETHRNILVNADVSFLNYSETFIKSDTAQNRHFIVIETGSKGDYLIKDGYIPSLPPTQYKGVCNFDNAFISNSLFYMLECPPRIITTSNKDLERNILQSIESFNENLKIADCYNFLISNIKEKINCKECLYEIAVNLSIGGIVASKKFFFEHVVNLLNNTEYMTMFNVINSKFFTMRILLIKLSFTKSGRDLENIINRIIEIKDYELKVLDSIYDEISKIPRA